MIWSRIQANIQRERETDLKKRKICDDEFTAYLSDTTERPTEHELKRL